MTQKKYTRKQTREIPQNLSGDKMQIISDVIYELFYPKDLSKYEVLTKRFALDGERILTLEEVGFLRGVTRQRIEQIEKSALKQLRILFETGESKHTSLNASVLMLIQGYQKSLTQFVPAIDESTLISHAETYLDTKNVNIEILRLILSIFGYNSLKLETSKIIWIFEPTKIDRLEELIHRINKFLIENCESYSWQDIILGISKKYRSARYKPDEVQLALSLSPNIELLENTTYQAKFDELRSASDRVYRLLSARSDTEPVDLAEISRLHNQEAIKYNIETHSTTYISKSLSNDKRFQNIGRSGLWVLKKWDYSPEQLMNVPDLIEYILKRAGDGLSVDSIFHEISQLRSISKNHIASDLSNNPKRFVKLKDGRYGLRKRANSNSVTRRQQRERTGLTAVKIALVIEEIFQKKNINQMKLSDLRQEISDMMPEYRAPNIWNMLSRSKAIEKSGEQGNLTATYDPSWRKSVSEVDLASKGERGVFIRRTIRDILAKNEKMSLQALRAEVSVLCHITPHNVFTYVKKMKDVIQEKGNDGVTYCKLELDIPSEYVGLLSKIIDPQIHAEAVRGISFLNIDDVDLGLFTLGRAFDEMSKRYFVDLATRGKIRTKNGIVSASDAKDPNKYKLATRIDLFVSNGILHDKNALTVLREERNDPAHNIQPIERRREMLITAATYAKWYIEYIIMFEEGIQSK